ncbi:hypothetical protein MFLO_14667 [Listeria floridensis FSL S10-1187]|uniref:Glycosyltransferase RgtA/B/C/D-like domain-containing protein n=1 Tax=Listeria floridensis FSL S10-1187 TaxID=1265817 RepID=A0ABN0RBV8_9LIST|nr:glycosyltransferase family 39 protein [Listeria floridensis]EUJ25861.1 hypothetical protein MFLO_14667 [Listeria floridensis FSL S10-1187]
MVRKGIGYSFTAAFVLIIGYLAYLSIAESIVEVIGSPVNMLLLALAALFLFAAAYKGMSLLSKKMNFIILIVLVVLIIAIQLFLVITMRMDALADSLVVKEQALTMLSDGGKFHDYIYFQTYLNNIFVTIIRYELYHFGSFFGIHNYYLMDNLFIMVLMNITIFSLAYIVKDSLGTKFTNLFLMLVLTCVPLFTYILYFYTDTLALPIVSLIVLSYYCYLKRGNWWILLIIGLLFAIGYQVKPNLIILFPAMVIHIWLVKNYKKNASKSYAYWGSYITFFLHFRCHFIRRMGMKKTVVILCLPHIL